MELHVLFGAATYGRRQFHLNMDVCEFSYSFLKSSKFHLGDNEKTFFTYGGVGSAIRKIKPDLVVCSGFSMATFAVWLSSVFGKTNYMIWSGSVQQKGRNDSLLRTWFRKIMLGKAKGFISYGTKAEEYLEMLGADPEKIKISLNTVDTAFFAEQTAALRSVLPRTNPQKHLTFVGYLSPRKNVGLLLESIRILAQKRNDFVLDLVGDGKEKPNLEKYVQSSGLSSVVKFHGFKQKEELPAILAVSTCFLFQTEFDIWGLVLNEAMAAGIPCISSVNAGATKDLIKDGETGFVMDFNDKANVVSKIEWILDHEMEARQIGMNARKFIEENASVKQSALDFVLAITSQNSKFV